MISAPHTAGAMDAVAETARALAAAGQTAADEHLARSLLGPLVPFGAAVECATPEDAAAAATRFGGEVVVKALVPGILHKSEHGLVSRPCRAPEVERVASDLLAAAAVAGPHEPRLSVQQRLTGVEIAAGFRQTDLGPACMVASGGTLVEVLDDSRVMMAPLDVRDASDAIQSLRAASLLAGYRGRPRADTSALARLLVELSLLALHAPEIRELDLNPIFVSAEGVAVADARCVLGPAERAAGGDDDDPATARDALRALFHPRLIAVVGASGDRRKVGGLLLRYLDRHDWPGDVVAVNPNGRPIDGVRTVRSLAELDSPPDLACIAVPAAATEEVVTECAERGVRSGIVYASGFAEAGEAGRAAQRRLRAAGGDRFRFVGPNSIGVANLRDRMVAAFGMGFESERLPVGGLAFASQSGAVASSLLSRADELGIGFSYWANSGNEADLGIAECVDYFAEAPGVEVICLLVEMIRRPAAFRAACRRAHEAGRPVVAVVTGRSEAGREATASHTGAMTGAAPVYDAFLEQCGVVRVDGLSELCVAAKALSAVGPTSGRRLGIISMSGGACSLLADEAAARGLEVPPLPADSQARARELLPSFAAVRNPVDVTAVGITDPGLVRETLRVVRTSGAVDLVVVQLSTNADPAAEAMASDLIAARDEEGVPFLVGRLGSPRIAPRAVERYRESGMVPFTWPEELAAAARACATAGELLGR